MSIDYTSLGKRIKRARLQKGITQGELADKIGLTLNYMGKVERGDKYASLDTVVEVANALEVSIEELLVDSLIIADSTNDNDISYLLLDLSNDEYSFFVKLLEATKELSKKFDIRRKAPKATK